MLSLFMCLLAIIIFFRWVLIGFTVIVCMASGGFLVGLGAGVVMWFFLKLLGWLAIIGAASTVIDMEKKDE